VNLTGEEGQVKKGRWTRQHWVSLLLIVAVLVIFVVIYFLSQALGDAWLYGYLGAFLISLMASAVVIIPVPGLPVIFLLGAILNPFVVGLMVGLAEPIGELTGYMAGYSGRITLENRRFYNRLEDWMKRRGSLVLFGFSAIPNPFTDVAGIAAGATRYSVRKFLLVMFLGKTAKGMLVAFAGHWTLGLVLSFLIG
jgi:uncharacterized membrane protein YdjX (TVP38/TMEM64 family)